MAEDQFRDAKGRITAGNPGKPRGAKDRAPRNPIAYHPRLQRQAAKDNVTAVHTAAARHMLKALTCLGQSAETNPADAERFLRLVAPITPRTYIMGAEHIADLPAEDRLAAIAALMARGVIDVASGTALASIIKSEIEFRYVRPLKAAVKELESALKTGDRRAAEDALFRLSKELGLAHTGTVEGEVVDG